MNYQERYWREMDQLKVHIFYLEEYLEKTIKIDRGIKIFLAVASSGSIAGWAIWQHISFVWGGIIAASQIVNSVKEYLPYSKRLKALQGITNDLEALFLNFESRWFDVAEGNLTNEEIHKMHMMFKEQRRLIIQKHLGVNPLPHKEHFMRKAIESTRLYFSNSYGFVYA